MIRRPAAVVAGLLLLGCGRAAQPLVPPPSRSDAAAAARMLPSGFAAAEESGTDAATGWPTRITHRPSGIVLRLVPAGEFEMGSPADEKDRDRSERQHRRAIRRPFYLGETEVTTAQFRRFVEATGYLTDAERGTPEGGGHGRGGYAATPDGARAWNEATSWRNPFPHLEDLPPREDYPVIHVSWNDTQRFCAHFVLRLPSEAEWEYACRAGTRTRYFWGSDEAGGNGYANVADASSRQRFPAVNWPFPFDDGAAVLSPVGAYRPNPWGFHDLIGNVEEWCQDVMQEYPADAADETPAEEGDAARVTRGSAWVGNPGIGRSASRVGMTPAARRDFIGFRVAWTPTP